MSSVDASKLLRSIADQYWQRRMANDPLFATSLGDRRFDGRLADITPRGRERELKEYQLLLEKVEMIPEHDLASTEWVTRSALRVDLHQQIDYLMCGLDDWSVDPLAGPQVEFFNVESYQPIRTLEEGRAMVSRWRSMGPYMNDLIANLQTGLASNRVAVNTCVRKVIEEIEDVLGKDDKEWPLLRPLRTPHLDWSEAQRAEFSDGIARAVRESIRPSFQSYLVFLRFQVLPKSRPDTTPGIAHLAGGSGVYRQLIQIHTSLSLTPEELHEIGTREVARINHELAALGKKLFHTENRKDFVQRLREDPSFYFTSRDEVEEKARAALARANSAVPKWFGRQPKVECEVMRMGDHEEKNSTIAYYRQPAADGSRPGQYYVNTSAPETRPRYEAEVLAYHESVPGHHLQLSIAQELEGIPAFRKHSGVTAFVEGWGLYAERLADEMGLYSSDLDRVGLLSYDAWRACRLVVDTGMHAKNWSRQDAIDYMLENTALAANNIVNEVDRYITWPGQALAYKVGQLEILRLREECKSRLGDHFDIRRFHDVLLGNGAVPLDVLRRIVTEYIEHELGKPSR